MLPTLIRQVGADWELFAGDQVVATHPTYDLAVRDLADQLAAADAVPAEVGAAAEGDGLLPEGWLSDVGIAFNEQPEPGRDFTNVAWSWRNPTESLLPLMLQTETEMGHFGAVLAGYITELSSADGAVQAAGRFYDQAAGAQARDLLLGGRRFGVSVDPGPGTEADVVCAEEDADGFCTDVRMDFSAYEVIGLTMTPFPAFARASIVLGDAAAAGAVADAGAAGTDDGAAARKRKGYTAAASADQERRDAIRARPPRAWLTMPEPELGDPLLIAQDGSGNRWGVPLTITDDGQVFGHLALWGECLRNGSQLCLEPPDSAAAYAEFHTGGVVVCDDGTELATGPLVVGCDHYPTNPFQVDRSTHTAVRDWYAAQGLKWADARATSGTFGVWLAGRVQPGITDTQLSILRSLSPSGDWNPDGEWGMELCAVLSVNRPGYPVRREPITAAALAGAGITASATLLGDARPRVYVRDGRMVAATGLGMVRGCRNCRDRELVAGADGQLLARAVRLLETMEVRTRHLAPTAQQAAIARLRGAAALHSD